MHIAAWLGSLDLATIFIDHGAHLEATDNDGFTPLATTTYSRNEGVTNVANLLLTRGACLDILSALSLGQLEYVRQEINRDPAVISRCPRHHLLLAAIRSKDDEILKAILDHIGTLDSDEFAYVLQIPAHVQPSTVRLLLDSGVDPNGISSNKTMLEIAKSHDFKEAVDLLREYGAAN